MSDRRSESRAAKRARDSAGDDTLNDSANPSLERAYKSRWAWLRFLLPAMLGLAADLWAKEYTFPAGILRDSVTHRLLFPQGRFRDAEALIPNVLVVQTTANEGAVFGLGQGNVRFFLVFSIVALGMITWVFCTSRIKQRWQQIALGLITAGALGNLYDRATFGAVRDFLRFTVSWYPFIFNIADVLLCIGVPLLMLCWIFTKDPRKPAAK